MSLILPGRELHLLCQSERRVSLFPSGVNFKTCMSNDRENLRSSFARRFALGNQSPDVLSQPSQREMDFRFAMGANGHFLDKKGKWDFDVNSVSPLAENFEGQRVSFFGPGSFDSFFSPRKTDHNRFTSAFRQRAVVDTIRKYREIDEDQAGRLAFLFGGIIRHWADAGRGEKEIADAVRFLARMTQLGNKGSADAIASAMAMYAISGGSFKENNHFAGAIYHMAEAVDEDPIVPEQTEDLGISQVARIRRFWDKSVGLKERKLPDLEEYNKAFSGFPTVGAEFHFPLSAQSDQINHPNLWQRLAILNMSQYQPGSYVQFSRNDRDVIEVRMNPSFYPITIANWNQIRLLLPEINQAFFTMTFNRKGSNAIGEGGNFYWRDENDNNLLRDLRALGMLTYAGTFENVPRSESRGEIGFGKVYLGQTVKLNEGKFDFSGLWGISEGNYGQLGIYAGFGDNFPPLAYYGSMALTDPSVMQLLSSYNVTTLEDALNVSPADRQRAFASLQGRVEKNKNLSRAFDAGNRIIELLGS